MCLFKTILLLGSAQLSFVLSQPLGFIGDVVNLGPVTFGTTSLGYGFKPTSTSSVVMIPNALNPSNRPFALASNPGGGWIGLAVVGVSTSKFSFFWKNGVSKQYSRWDLNEKGAAKSTELLSYQELLAAEFSFGFDLDGDKQIGIPYSGRVFTAGQVKFGTTPFGYGLC
jgi:hypothetical protein